MAKTLQQIKDEVSEIDNFHNWAALFDSFAMYDYEMLESAIDQVAVRYAQEQKRELMEMLEMINEGIHTMDFFQLERIQPEIEQLITKHKQS